MTFATALIASALSLFGFIVVIGIFSLIFWAFKKMADAHPLLTIVLSIVAVWFLFACLLMLPNSAHAAEIRGSSVYAQSNQVRFENHVKPLAVSPVLVKAAQERANDMAKLHYFSHRSPTGRNFWDAILAQKTYFHSAGENLAEGFIDTIPLFQAWKNSPTHFANIVDPTYVYTGIGIAHDGSKTIVVQLFSTK